MPSAKTHYFYFKYVTYSISLEKGYIIFFCGSGPDGSYSDPKKKEFLNVFQFIIKPFRQTDSTAGTSTLWRFQKS